MAEHKTVRIDLRANESEKQTLARAAALKGVSLSRFILASSRAAADEVLAEQSRFGLSAEQFRALNEALDSEPKVVTGLAELFRRPHPFLE